MLEILHKGFETPELASTNLLSLLTLVLSLVTAAEGHLWVRTRERARKVTMVILTLCTTRNGVTEQLTEEVIEEAPPLPAYSMAARKLRRNASLHRF